MKLICRRVSFLVISLSTSLCHKWASDAELNLRQFLGSYRGHAICWRSDISIHQVAPQRGRRDRDSKRDRTKEKEEEVPWHKSGGEFLRSRRILLTYEWGASVQKHFYVQTNKQLRNEALYYTDGILVWILIALRFLNGSSINDSLVLLRKNMWK